MLQSLNWETLQACMVNMRLSIIYKAYYNLAIFPLLQYATPTTIHIRGHNIKFILPHWSKDVFKHSFLPVTLRAWNALPEAAVEADTLSHFKASLPGAPNCFYPALSGSVIVNCKLFSFSGITSHRQY